MFEMQILMHDKLADFVYTLLYVLYVFAYANHIHCVFTRVYTYSPGWTCSSRYRVYSFGGAFDSMASYGIKQKRAW